MIMEEDQPVDLRRKRRSCTGGEVQSRSNSAASTLIEVSMPAPATPRRGGSRKQVRFSDPGPNLLQTSTSGLTPFIRKTSISSAKSHRRHSAPVRLLGRRQGNEPYSGELQFAPLRQVLDGRITRRLKRNRLSEETNKIDWEKKHEAKARKSELYRLRRELEEKNYELQCVKDEYDVASQLGFEAGTSTRADPVLAEKFQEMVKEIQELKAELSQKEERAIAHHDWQTGTQDPFDFDDDDDDDDDHNMILSVDGDHGVLEIQDDDAGMAVDSPCDDHEMTKLNGSFSNTEDSKIMPTRHNLPFPSPPATIADSSSQKPCCASSSTQANFPDPLSSKLESQLLDLQAEIKSLNSALALNKDHEHRLSRKLSTYIPSDQSHDNPTLDSALDSVLTTLALAQAQVLEKEASFNALSNEVTSLGFSTDPETTIRLIVEQFRAARLEFESLAPGEATGGFQNDKLLSMLLARLRSLVEKVKKQDQMIDQYHEQEVILRQQLAARIDALHDVQKELSAVSTAVSRMSKEVAENEILNSRLQTALDGYRSEVSGLQTLVEAIEEKHQAIEDDFKRGIHNLDDQLQREIMRADTFAVELEGKNMIVGELSARLTAALKASETLQDLIDEKEGQIFLSDRQHDEDLRERDDRIAGLQEELERTTLILKNTQKVVEHLKHENSDLKTENEDLDNVAERLKEQVHREKRRGKKVVEGMRRQLAGVLNLGNGYLESDGNESSETEAGECTTHLQVKGPVVRRGQYLDAGLARRRSSGGGGLAAGEKKKKRRYDSGLGFLEEEEEEEEQEEDGTENMHGDGEGVDILA
ncbi:hypothetical protein DSL72_000766 [Monilinia vaccinii-corymbosi]|uniref:Uncharacterized protein n=1 Tax=Monilinia vaccinii-corymbosi TaxID=61207 RepID=A0A8A3P097_9HELO|nr:hypothetical protein DSL72_000766 [Monilinia vaccinii-corymbosi]